MDDLPTTTIRAAPSLNSSGKIQRPARLGGQLRWSRTEIDNWIAAGMPDRRS